MPKVFYTLADGSARVVDGVAGDSVMATAVRNDVPGIVGQCGGTLSCATCHVFVDPDDFGSLSPLTELEDEMLECAATDRTPASRLSCQLVLSEGTDIRVTVPAAQL